MTLNFLLVFVLTQRADPDMCRARDRVGCLQGVAQRGAVQFINGIGFHPYNLDELLISLLSKPVKVDSIHRA